MQNLNFLQFRFFVIYFVNTHNIWRFTLIKKTFLLNNIESLKSNNVINRALRIMISLVSLQNMKIFISSYSYKKIIYIW
jgi:hypothetical protein